MNAPGTEAVQRLPLQAPRRAPRGAGLYASLGEVRGLLELLEIETAPYELRSELDNRPGWVGIPLQGLLALLGNGRGP